MTAGLTLTDHTFTVPLDYGDKSRGDITVFVREAVAYSRPKQVMPYLLFLQGQQLLTWPCNLSQLLKCFVISACMHAR